MLIALGLTHEDIEGSTKEKPSEVLCGMTPRHAMQTLGTEWGRQIIHDEIWINIFLDKVESSETVVVCDDLRCQNEYDSIQYLEPLIINILSNKQRSNDKHPSETAELPYDYQIMNNHDKSSENKLFEILSLTW